jgi:O-methyltransferase involved in polyketide biosynthesis
VKVQWKMTTTTVNLQGVARTLLVPLACRARETARPDALMRDPRAVQLFKDLGGGMDCLMGMGELDQTFTVMRARQFDRYARAFLDAHPQGMVVDIGCGLDTRFDRLDNGQMHWLGLDLPEVITLRRQLLPDAQRCQTIAQSMLDLMWLDIAAHINRPAIFLAEGVFPYFTEVQVRPVITALAERFAGGELVFDALSSFSARLHNHHPVLKKAGARINWGVDDPHALETWKMRLLDQWGYFDKHEPRLGLAHLMRYVPPLANANFVLHYRLGPAPAHG